GAHRSQDRLHRGDAEVERATLDLRELGRGHADEPGKVTLTKVAVLSKCLEAKPNTSRFLTVASPHLLREGGIGRSTKLRPSNVHSRTPWFNSPDGQSVLVKLDTEVRKGDAERRRLNDYDIAVREFDFDVVIRQSGRDDVAVSRLVPRFSCAPTQVHSASPRARGGPPALLGFSPQGRRVRVLGRRRRSW